jgi:hypothetical protein
MSVPRHWARGLTAVPASGRILARTSIGAAGRTGLRSRAAAAVVVATLLAGCSTVGPAVGIEENTFESGPLPAIADEQATVVLDQLDEVINEANASRDPELLATVVADPLLALESARYALDATADPEDAEPALEIERSDPTVFVPRFAGYPQWFVVASTLVEDAPMRLEVVTRDAASAPWELVTSTDLLPGVEFPELALDEAGYVVPLTDNDLAALPVSPDELVAGHAEVLGGEEPTGVAATLAEDPWSVARLEADAARGPTVGAAASVAVTYEPGAALPHALRTEDGGALVFYDLSERVVYTVNPTYFLQLDAATAALAGVAEIRTSLTEDWSALLAVHVPADGSGEARVVGARFERTGLTGS